MRRVPVKLSLRPDLYENLQTYAAGLNTSCSRAVEIFTMNAVTAGTQTDTKMWNRVLKLSEREKKPVSEILKRAILAGLEACESDV